MSIKWTKAPTKTYWGDMMVQAYIEIDADHTLSLYCELDQADKVTAMLNEANELRARNSLLQGQLEGADLVLQERDETIKDLRALCRTHEHFLKEAHDELNGKGAK